MTLLSDVYEILAKINKLHIEDPKIYEYWEELTKVLTADEEATIDLLYSLEDSDAIDNISSVFEDVSRILQSRNFISCIESLEVKFPDLLLVHMINAA